MRYHSKGNYMNKIKEIHLIGIGGIGMSSLAQFLIKKNKKITGSDVSKNTITKRMKRIGCFVSYTHKAENIKNQDLVICSTAIDKKNPEIVEARRKKIKIISRGEALGLFTKDYKNISISGCHGKSTTTSMTQFLLNKSGVDSTLFLGAIDSKLKSNFYDGSSKVCVIEADESDNSFNYLNSYVSVITNIDNDHLDFYKTKKNLKNAFAKFGNSTKAKCIINNDCKITREIASRINSKKLIKFGQFNHKENDYSFTIKKNSGQKTFSLFNKTSNLGEFKTKLKGEYNIYNSVCSVVTALETGGDLNIIRKNLASFASPSRRFETIVKTKELTIVDDYGHHPNAINAIRLSIEEEKRKIILVFQPHRFSRTKILFNAFASELSEWDNVYLVDIYSAFENTKNKLDSKLLYKEIKKINSKVKYFSSKEKLREKIISESKKRDTIVITMGAGDIRDVGFDIKNKINKY